MRERTFIVDFWAAVFDLLRWASPFFLLHRLLRRRPTYFFVDTWVLAHLLASLSAVAYIRLSQNNFLWYLILIYSYLRVFEITIYQANVLLFDEYRASSRRQVYYLRSYRRTVILLLHNYFEIILWFGASYLVLAGDFAFEGLPRSLAGVIYSSFAVMSGFGSPAVRPMTAVGLCILWAQSLVGLFMTLLSLARFVSIMPAPGSLEDDRKR